MDWKTTAQSLGIVAAPLTDDRIGYHNSYDKKRRR
jgi:hypothetical protein